MTHRSSGWGGSRGFRPFENDQDVVGDRFEQANGVGPAKGRLFFDRAYVGKWALTYRAGRDVRFGAVARYQDGQPFSRLVVVPDLAVGPDIVEAYPQGRTRFTYTATLDVRLEKGFRVGQGRVAVRLDAFNLTNHKNEVEEDVVTGPTFRRSTAVQPPVTLRVGINAEF
jgi:hypothetical protein